MESDGTLEELVDETLATAVRSLFKSRTQQNHWDDVRSTGAAVWALEHLLYGHDLQGEHLVKLKHGTADAATWLAGQARRDEGGVSWESEAWDTSFAIFALVEAGVYEEKVDQAAAWLEGIRCKRTGVWYDEIWETTLATVALLHRQVRRKGPKQECDKLVLDVIKWLIDIPSKPSGEYVNPHYSAFIVWLDAEMRQCHLKARTLKAEEYSSFQAKVKASADWLVGYALANPEDLWCPYTFSNAYIAFALALHPDDFGQQGADFLLPVVEWFDSQQGTEGGFEDTEDSALAVIALTTIRDLLCTPWDTLDQRLSRVLSETSPVGFRCFLGYAGKAADIAKGMKGYLKEHVPYLDLVDWKGDFTLGETLAEGIEKHSKTCQLAIFLLTKDDSVVTEDATHLSPRDNVVFEVGVFFGTVGRGHTILVVEAGVELPSDWDGILHIPFDRKDLGAMHEHLCAEVKKLLKRH